MGNCIPQSKQLAGKPSARCVWQDHPFRAPPPAFPGRSGCWVAGWPRRRGAPPPPPALVPAGTTRCRADRSRGIRRAGAGCGWWGLRLRDGRAYRFVDLKGFPEIVFLAQASTQGRNVGAGGQALGPQSTSCTASYLQGNKFPPHLPSYMENFLLRGSFFFL